MQIDSSSTMKAGLPLRPAMHPVVTELTANNQPFLRELVRGLGSPLNIVLPALLAPNVTSFGGVFAKHGVRGQTFFAHKATQSDSLVRQLAVTKGLHMDVASLNELRHAVSCGFEGTRLQATGPKNDDFLALCLLHDVTINVDSFDELRRLLAVQCRLTLGRKAKVLLRQAGFNQSDLAKASRFGISIKEMQEAFGWLQTLDDKMELLGFSFHLDSISQQERLMAIAACLELFEQALDHGFTPRVLDIGGGFRINYLAHEEDWLDYVSSFKESVLGRGAPLAWHDAKFGLSSQNGQLRGAFNTYGFYERRPGALFLDDLLSNPLPGHSEGTLGRVLAANDIELWIEPGRALLDQAGFTVAQVNGVRQSSQSHQLVLLGMKRSDIAFLDQEMFVDPVVLYNNTESANTGSPVPVFFAGNLCLESDLIYRHLTFLPRLPQAGDLVALVNTAAYMMGFSASEAIMQPPARKVAVYWDRATERFTWALDAEFSALQTI